MAEFRAAQNETSRLERRSQPSSAFDVLMSAYGRIRRCSIALSNSGGVRRAPKVAFMVALQLRNAAWLDDVGPTVGL